MALPRSINYSQREGCVSFTISVYFMSLSSFTRRLGRVLAEPDIAIDLGTANTRVCTEHGPVINERSSILHDATPLRAGVVVDSALAAEILSPMILATRRWGLRRPRALACVPTDASEGERAALVEAVRGAGAASVTVALEPLAAAIGAGLDVAAPHACMVIDIGEGVTDMAVFRQGRVMRTHAMRAACGDVGAALRAALHIDTMSCDEVIRITQGMDFSGECEPAHTNDELLYTATAPVLDAIVSEAVVFARDLSPQLGCEIIESGVWLTGGGALLPGLARRFQAALALDVRSASDPLHAVIRGAQQMLRTTIDHGLWQA